MSEETVQRLRIIFAKGQAIKYISHLDLAKTIERILRRAELPLVFSQGYNPRPKIALASALAVGFVGQRELVDIWIAPPMEPADCLARISGQSPAGLTIHQVTEAPLEQKSLQSLLRQAEYAITVSELPGDLPARLEHLMAQDFLPRERERKGRVRRYDLRPLIDALWPISADPARFGARLACSSSGTGRPDELIAALGLEDAGCAIERTRLIFAEDV